MTAGVLDQRLPLVPLRRVSPSRFAGIKACPLREVWAAAGNAPLLPRPPAARAGMAIHQLLEEAGKGLLPAERAAVARRWDELVAEAETAMRENWLERQFVPLRSAVPDLEVRRLRAAERALAIAEAAAEKRPGQENGVAGFERWVESRDGSVGGYIDHVVAAPAGAVLRDYKSGSIHEATPGSPPALREGFVAQLRLYAALYVGTAGSWPAGLELVPLQGQPVAVPFDRQECEALLAEAVAALREVNAVIASQGDSPGEVERRLARPGEQTCRQCVYRPACAAYRIAREGDAAGGDWPEDVWGELQDVKRLGNGKLLLAVAGDEGREARQVRGISPGDERHPALVRLKQGDRVGLFNLKGGVSGGTRGETAWTVIYQLPHEGGQE